MFLERSAHCCGVLIKKEEHYHCPYQGYRCLSRVIQLLRMILCVMEMFV